MPKRKFLDSFFRALKRDDEQSEKINKMIERKDTKALNHHTKRWLKEGRYWDKKESREARRDEKFLKQEFRKADRF